MINVFRLPTAIIVLSLEGFFSDPEDLRREIQEMIGMMSCKSCNTSKATCVNLNIKCRHLICSRCRDELNTCEKCGEMITATAPVKFADK